MVHHEEIRRAWRRQPFEPFVLFMADGRSFPIAHPELIFVTRNGRSVVFEDTDGFVEILATALITSIAVPNDADS